VGKREKLKWLNFATMELYIILVEPAVPENVGAAARALKTMGFAKMRLVNPCNHLADGALKLAHASAEILENAEVFDTLADARADLDFCIATSAKRRNVKQNYIAANELSSFIQGKLSTINSLGVVFGREESGLTNEELKLCEVVTYIPMVQKYPSLNLGQAVMLFTYELSKLHIYLKKKKHKPANHASYRVMSMHINRVLSSTDLVHNQQAMIRINERIGHLAEDDLFMVHAVALALLKKLDLE
jgi:tRNA/rRNA methyltransferase